MTVRRTTPDRISLEISPIFAKFPHYYYYTFEELLLQLSLGDLDLDGLINLLGVALLVVGIVLDGGREQSVDECGLSQSRLSSNLWMSVASLCACCCNCTHHNSESRTPFSDDLVSGRSSSVFPASHRSLAVPHYVPLVGELENISVSGHVLCAGDGRATYVGNTDRRRGLRSGGRGHDGDGSVTLR